MNHPTTKKHRYPKTKRNEVVDDYHGITVPDPYRWLENLNDPDTRAWLEGQQGTFDAFMNDLGGRDTLRERLAELNDHPKFSTPIARGNRLFYFKNEGLAPQPTLFVQDAGATRALLDPNALSADGTVAITAIAPSPDGALLAYATAGSGSDWQEIRVCEVDTGKVRADVLRWCKFAQVAWQNDSSGFYYNRFPDPATVAPEAQTHHSRVCWHQLGTDQTKDTVIYERPDAKELIFFPRLSDDHKKLVLHLSQGSASSNRIHLRAHDGTLQRLFDLNDARYLYLGNKGETYFFHTDKDAPRGRVVAVDLDRPEPKHWRELAPECKDVLVSATRLKGAFVLVYQRDVSHHVEVVALDGTKRHKVTLPQRCTVFDPHGGAQDSACYITLDSFLHPPGVYRLDAQTGTLEPFLTPSPTLDPESFEVSQAAYPSKDGTRVPIWLLHRKGLSLDGQAPSVLYGYGGFNQSLTPSYSALRALWIERGGVFAVANLRGGSEFGERWHEAGMLERKQNVFDDFIAAAQWLCDQGYTRRKKLAIWGRSNGGLLVSACMVQRPELFGAVVCGVPVADMLRYHRFTVGRFWVPEYGNAEKNPEHFKFLHAYSPLHNVDEEATYPPTLVYTAETDDRVVPWHSMKLTAALQRAEGGPIVLRFETKAGHGMGKPMGKVIDEQVDVLTFLFATIGG